MPRMQIADMLQVRPGLFDVVIADEASQLGVESLFLFYIADQQIIVGDDKQITPSTAGIDENDIEALQRRYLADFPTIANYNAQASVYSNAKIHFDVTVTLREHFRCMPEIIQFCLGSL